MFPKVDKLWKDTPARNVMPKLFVLYIDSAGYFHIVAYVIFQVNMAARRIDWLPLNLQLQFCKCWGSKVATM